MATAKHWLWKVATTLHSFARRLRRTDRFLAACNRTLARSVHVGRVQLKATGKALMRDVGGKPDRQRAVGAARRRVQQPGNKERGDCSISARDNCVRMHVRPLEVEPRRHQLALHRQVSVASPEFSDKTARGGYAAFAPHNFLLAIAAPSLSARNFAQTIESATVGSARTAVPKPQSTPAMTRSRPTMSA